MGYSNAANSCKRARISAFCSLRLPKPRPGSSTMRLLSTPERRARLALASRSLTTALIMSGIGGSFAHVSGVPRIWFKIRPASLSTTTFASSGSKVKPLGSLMISAPCSIARAATSALYVSTEMGIRSSPFKRFNTGIRRRSSSAADTRVLPGLVDSAPISRMSAPCSSSSNARANAPSRLSYTPSPENESGVTFSTATTRVRSPRRISRDFSFHEYSFLGISKRPFSVARCDASSCPISGHGCP